MNRYGDTRCAFLLTKREVVAKVCRVEETAAAHAAIAFGTAAWRLEVLPEEVEPDVA